jgi:hypothetical protein
MTSIRAVLTILATPFVIYATLLACYVANPTIVHWRGWELFDVFTFNGIYSRTINMVESGDSSRDYLIQRFKVRNTISVNEFGNRNACHDSTKQDAPGLLIVGDSQLFGSGSDDSETFPAQLCTQHHANAYNGARRHGLQLLRVNSLRFRSILFTTTERSPLAARFCDHATQMLLSNFDSKIDPDGFLLPAPSPSQRLKALKSAHAFLFDYLGSRLQIALKGAVSGLRAPDARIFFAAHRFEQSNDVVRREIECAKSLAQFFEPRGYSVGFMYFPAHQTVYGPESGLDVDSGTLTFIDKATEAFGRAGLRSMNSKSCLEAVKGGHSVNHIHDTHLNATGFAALARCAKSSPLYELVTGSGGRKPEGYRINGKATTP